MARYTGPKCKLVPPRGHRPLPEERPPLASTPSASSTSRPGQHGAKSTRVSEYGTQLREKQKIRRMYGVLERQFRNYFDKADAEEGRDRRDAAAAAREPPGQRRLPHGLRLHARRGAPARLAQGDRGERQAGEHPVVPAARDRHRRRCARSRGRSCASRPRSTSRKPNGFPSWVEVDSKNFKGVFKALPDRAEIATDVNEQLVVELYSK